jgi:adenosine deaminase
LIATCNSDDPAYFGGYVADNFQQTAIALSMTDEELIALAKNSFVASFIDDATRHAYLAELDRFVSDRMTPGAPVAGATQLPE